MQRIFLPPRTTKVVHQMDVENQHASSLHTSTIHSYSTAASALNQQPFYMNTNKIVNNKRVDSRWWSFLSFRGNSNRILPLSRAPSADLLPTSRCSLPSTHMQLHSDHKDTSGSVLNATEFFRQIEAGYDFFDILRSEVNHFFEFQNKSLQEEFLQFMNRYTVSKSRSSGRNSPTRIFFLVIIWIMTILLAPQSMIQFHYFLQWNHIQHGHGHCTIQLIISFLSMISIISCCLIGWIVYGDECSDRTSSVATNPTTANQSLYTLTTRIDTSTHGASNHAVSSCPLAWICQILAVSKSEGLKSMYSCFMVFCQVYFIMEFLKVVFNMNCAMINTDSGSNDQSSPIISTILSIFGNNVCLHSNDGLDGMKIEFLNAYCLELFVLPFICWKGVFPQTSIRIIWLNYVLAGLIFVASVVGNSAPQCLLSGIVWMLLTFFAIRDFQARNMIIFLSSRNVKDSAMTNNKAMEETHANEMRSLIANVAHDLKTPLASFTTGLDFIQITIDEFESSLPSSTTQIETRDMVYSIQQCLNNIRNTNTFMLMTINRCIDYTKVSKGVKLLPHLETTDLMETIQLPLQCMRNIQSRMKISIAPNKGNPICSHVVTDKLWLQENVLCLLSNAVKYSNDGEIIVSLHVQTLESLSQNNSDSKLNNSTRITDANKDDQNHHQDQAKDAIVTKPTRVSFNQCGRPNLAELVHSMSMLSNGSNASCSNLNAQKMLVIEVEDTGIGMTDEAMKILFNPFHQTQRLAGGTGLGLFSLAKRVEALHGKYGVRRRRDGRQGSLFWFAIPYRPDHFMAEVYANNSTTDSTSALETIMDVTNDNETTMPLRKLTSWVDSSFKDEDATIRFADIMSPSIEHENHRTKSQSKLVDEKKSPVPGLFHGNSGLASLDESRQRSQAAPSFSISPRVTTSQKLKRDRPLHILLADDSPAILKMVALMLTKLGHHVSTAENGQIAVNMIKDSLMPTDGNVLSFHGCFDIIIMDLQMPIMDGLEAITRIRSAEKECNSVKPIWIIGCSADSDTETQDAAFAAGASMFMLKPYNVTTFCCAIAAAKL